MSASSRVCARLSRRDWRWCQQNLLFGARTSKLCVDCKPWGYSVEDITLVIAEAAKGGAKVDGHVQTRDGGQQVTLEQRKPMVQTTI